MRLFSRAFDVYFSGSLPRQHRINSTDQAEYFHAPRVHLRREPDRQLLNLVGGFMLRFRSTFLMVVCALLAIAPIAHAQVTTGNLAGTVSANDGSALPGVTVEAVHVPTGTRYQAVTDSNGRYVMQNVRVGGPYRVTASLEG